MAMSQLTGWGSLFSNVLIMTLHSTRSREIAALNDFARKTLQECRVVFTEGILALEGFEQFEILNQVRVFEACTPDNDPYGEHDFGSFEYEGRKIYWKWDYYDKHSLYLSPDPTSATMTNRVLTIMLAEEY